MVLYIITVFLHFSQSSVFHLWLFCYSMLLYTSLLQTKLLTCVGRDLYCVARMRVSFYTWAKQICDSFAQSLLGVTMILVVNTSTGELLITSVSALIAVYESFECLTNWSKCLASMHVGCCEFEFISLRNAVFVCFYHFAVNEKEIREKIPSFVLTL